MKFFAYENWRANGHLTKIHRGDCAFCQNGKGIGGGTRNDNGRWIELGEFETANEALSAARMIVAEGTARLCGKCSKEHFTDE